MEVWQDQQQQEGPMDPTKNSNKLKHQLSMSKAKLVSNVMKFTYLLTITFENLLEKIGSAITCDVVF